MSISLFSNGEIVNIKASNERVNHLKKPLCKKYEKILLYSG